MMLHAQHKRPEAITANLWPYAIRHAKNATTLLAHPQGLSPLQIFTGTQVQNNPKHLHPFGCPTYVLNEALRSYQRIHHKWKTRSKVGLYLGQYPLHNHAVALVLNRDSGLVSPQLNVCYDPLFTTTKKFDSSSLWQVRLGFVRQEGHTLSRADRAAKRAALSTHPSPQEGGKRDLLYPSAPGCHSQPEGDSSSQYQQEGELDAHFSPQEVASSDDNPSQ